jgi:hypothetical protein
MEEGSRTAPDLPVEFPQLRGSCLVVFFEKPESFADDLAGRVVAAGLDLGADKFLELRGKRDVGKADFSIRNESP